MRLSKGMKTEYPLRCLVLYITLLNIPEILRISQWSNFTDEVTCPLSLRLRVGVDYRFCIMKPSHSLLCNSRDWLEYGMATQLSMKTWEVSGSRRTFKKAFPSWRKIKIHKGRNGPSFMWYAQNSCHHLVSMKKANWRGKRKHQR